MLDFLPLLLAFIIGFSGVFGYEYIHAKATEPPTPELIQPIETNGTHFPEPTFALVPPSQAVSGILTITSGHAKKLSRNDTDYKEASSGATILLGESIATDDTGSAYATVSGVMKATLGNSAELVFANLFPANFVLQQKSGKIDYFVSSPISVRALHTLITMQPGDVIVSIIDTDMSVTVNKGSVKFALVDADNTTRVYSLTEGHRYNIDDAARQVFLVR